MPMDFLLFEVNDEMNISFGKFLPRYNYVKKNLYAEWWHNRDTHTFELIV
jgi:homogentisate 1,2-dioxygenase